MVISQPTVPAARRQQETKDIASHFRALAMLPDSEQANTGKRSDRQPARSSSDHPSTDSAEEYLFGSYPSRQYQKEDNNDRPMTGRGGASLSNVLACMLVESARKSPPTAEDWTLIVPLERTRFPDSAVLVSSGRTSLSVEFRSYHGSVILMLEPIVSSVASMVRQGLGRPVQCEVQQVASIAELYRC